MRFGLNEDQKLLADSVARQLQSLFDGAAVRAFTEGQVLDRAWAGRLAEAGIFGVCASEAVGGIGLGATEAVLLALAAGRQVAPFPLSDMVLAARLLGDHAAADRIVAGRELACFTAEPGLALGQGRVNGALTALPWAMTAAWLVAPVGGAASGAYCLVDLRSDAVTRHPVAAADLTAPAASIELKDAVPAEIIAQSREIELLAPLLAAAEAVGAAETAFGMTLDYVKTREQFGRKVGSFQAVKQKLGYDAVAVESMKVAIHYAGWVLDAGAADRQMAVSIAKSYVSTWARRVCEDAIQCHGGIGFTWEYPLHLYLRRVLARSKAFGSSFDHRARIAGLLARTARLGRAA
jgi:alkylation response protein AidB-like acyl-CoA dehydrogenase